MTTDKPLRLHGVSRFTDDSHIVLLHFDRSPTDDELREVHECIADEAVEHTADMAEIARLTREKAEAIKYRDDEFQLRDALANENARLRAELLEWKWLARNNGLMTAAQEREFMEKHT